MPGRPLGADSVEKVLSAVGIQFLRAADAFNAVRHGGPHRLEQNLSATFFFAWRTHPQKKSAPASFYEDFALAALSTSSTESANSRRLPLLAVPPQTASVQLSENANADVEKGRPSRSRGQDCPLA